LHPAETGAAVIAAELRRNVQTKKNGTTGKKALREEGQPGIK